MISLLPLPVSYHQHIGGLPHGVYDLSQYNEPLSFVIGCECFKIHNEKENKR